MSMCTKRVQASVWLQLSGHKSVEVDSWIISEFMASTSAELKAFHF